MPLCPLKLVVNMHSFDILPASSKLFLGKRYRVSSHLKLLTALHTTLCFWLPTSSIGMNPASTDQIVMPLQRCSVTSTKDTFPSSTVSVCESSILSFLFQLYFSIVQCVSCNRQGRSQSVLVVANPIYKN